MRRILVTAVSGNIGYGILKILQSKDHVLFGCDVNEIAAGMDLVKEFWQCKYAVEEGYIEELLMRCKEHGITHLIPVNEREIERIGQERKRFEAINVKVVIQSRKVLDICLDKYATATFLLEHGFDVPATYADNSPKEAGQYIIKPRKSNGSKNIVLLASKEEIPDQIEEDCILQEYIESEGEYTIGVFRHSATINVIAFLRQLKDGYSSQVELTAEKELIQIAQRAAQVFELEGYMNIQLRKKDGKYYIFEINPRISGTVRFRHMLGYTDVWWWLDLLDGMEVPPYQNRYKRAVGVRELNEKFLILE